MRLPATIAFLGIALLIATAQAETPPASVPAAGKADDGSARANSRKKLARPGPSGAQAPDSGEAETAPVTPPTPPVPLVAAAAPLEFPVKETTSEDLARIRIGASEKDVLASLGTPASRIVLLDDDGHLRKSYQYWAKGSPVGTIRLDNGLVVKVEIKRW
jgi:hypothetical protein